MFSDASWGAFGFNAAQALNSKYGHEVDFKDDVLIPDIEATLRGYAADGYDMIIAQGYHRILKGKIVVPEISCRNK